MPKSVARTAVLADLHLMRRTPAKLTRDIVSFVDGQRGNRIVFAGDLLDLSAESDRVPSEKGIAEVLGAHPIIRRAFGEHLDHGGELWFVAGNHDAEVAAADFRSSILSSIGTRVAREEQVRATPWFFHEAGAHIEHGHLYDPDNAPAHPLSPCPSLGVHFVEEFIAKTGAHAYLNKNDGTPLNMFLSSFKLYGPRAPYVIARFFSTSFGALLKSGPFFRALEREKEGARHELRFAEEADVADEVIRALLDGRPLPTLASMKRTFLRLYLDRVAASLGILGGATYLLSGKRGRGALLLSLGLLGMFASWSRGRNRYGGGVVRNLEEGAHRVGEITGAKFVIFGHTHREITGERYANTGSFAFPSGSPGRPYLMIHHEEGEARKMERAYWKVSA